MNDPTTFSTALKLIRRLRSEVVSLFAAVDEGVAAQPEDRGQFISDVQIVINSSFQLLRDIEVSVANIQPTSGPMVLQNSVYLAQESTSDKEALYSPLILSHKWADKIHKYSSIAHNMLSNNSLRKCGIKRKRMTHSIPPPQVDLYLSNVERCFTDLSITISRPCGSNVVMQVTVGRVLQALIAFRGIMIDWVVIKGYSETCNTVADLSSESRYHTFRRVTEHARAAILHFSSPAYPEVSAKSYLMWLNSYNTLFNDSCKKCGKYFKNFYPPTWRDFRSFQAAHYECAA